MGERKQDIASDFCQDTKHIDYLVYVRNIDSFALYNEDRGRYKIYADEEFEKYVYKYMVKTYLKDLGMNTVRDIITQIKWNVYRELETEVSDYIAFKDKLLNLKTFEFEEFDYLKNAFYSVECDSSVIQEGSKCDRFTQFLDEVIVNPDLTPDKEMQKVVQEMFGYYFLNTNDGHQMFFWVGEGRNGKSVLMSLLEDIIGEQFIAYKTLEDLTTKEFAPVELVGKKMNICNEDESKFVRSDKFKALVAGDKISVRRLYQHGFSMKPTAKFLFSTNEPPTFSGYTVALLDRINIIKFNRYFKKEERDPTLAAKLLKERDGIIRWVIEGAKRIYEQRYVFSYSVQVEQAKDEFEKNISSAVEFLDENYEETDWESWESDDDIYVEYDNWCKMRNKKPMQMNNFKKDMVRKLKTSPKSETKSFDGRRKTARPLRRKI